MKLLHMLLSPVTCLFKHSLKTPVLAHLQSTYNSIKAKDQVSQSYTKTYISVNGGADKSLARPTSRSHRMESIVLLEREVSSCAKLQVFSRYRG